MSLVPFSPEHVRLQSALPFDLVDAAGQLLMPKGAVVKDRAQLQRLVSRTLMVQEEETVEWRRSLASTIDGLVRQNASLDTIARTNAAAAHPPARPAAGASFASEVADLQMKLTILLHDPVRDAAWLPRVQGFALRTRQLVERDADALLYLLVQTSTQEVRHYSSHHSFLCAAVVELCALQLHWSAEERRALMHAALTMNLAMTGLQNQLAQQDGPLTAEQKQRIAGHAAEGVELLRQAGVDDPLWLDVVRLHHDEPAPAPGPASLPPAQRLARVLRRADVFTAKISPRKTRQGLPAPLAARDACLGADGRPDDIGSATIKALGIYPPGSYVRLASGEVAVVMRRGARANQPRVASIVGRDGSPLGVPTVRDTTDPRFEVKSAARTSEVRIRVHHERMLSLL